MLKYGMLPLETAQKIQDGFRNETMKPRSIVTRFHSFRLSAACVYLLQVLIGSLDCLCPL